MTLLADIPWAMVSALAASAGVIVALLFQMRNLANTRLSNSAKMVLDLTGSFDSAEMRTHRGRFAKTLLEARDSIDLRKNTPVLEFFEELGYMTRRGVLDEGMVWNSFSWWFEPYYLAVTSIPDLIERARSRTKVPSLFRECKWLYGRMQQVSRREHATDTYIPPSEDHVREFLVDETKFAEPSDGQEKEEADRRKVKDDLAKAEADLKAKAEADLKAKAEADLKATKEHEQKVEGLLTEIRERLPIK